MTMDLRATDWDAYYAHPYVTASFTRRYTARKLVELFHQFGAPNPWIVELGGANSCFFDTLQAELSPSRYSIVDNNQKGLDLFCSRIARSSNVEAINLDLASIAPKLAGDIVFSIGLVEHFDEAGTRRVIDAHFSAVRPGGIVLISAPTPTLLYRIVRCAAEKLGLWIFHDERPISSAELERNAADQRSILYAQTLWPQILTQRCVVWRA
jgi:hypothetical protein